MIMPLICPGNDLALAGRGARPAWCGQPVTGASRLNMVNVPD
jgi:hypothetical protein